MNDAQLQGFRDIADAMTAGQDKTWQWVGQHMSQRMFGITKERAEAYAARHGGTASKMREVL